MPRTLAATVAALACLIGCPGPKKPGGGVAPSPDDRALRLRVARAEAVRGGGIAELRELALHGAKAERLLALRGLGRTGGAAAVATLTEAMRDRDIEIFAHAVAALGLAGSLDEEDTIDAAAINRLPKDPALVALVFEGIGRGGSAATQDTLVTGLEGSPHMTEAAAIGLGRHGRRKIALSPSARAAIAKAIGHADARVRYAAVWAAAREHQPPAGDDATAAALVARLVAGEEPETRAQAISALTRRKRAERAGPQVVEALRDRDWRIAAEAVRALTSDGATEAGRDAVAAILARRFADLERGEAGEAHVILEALRGLANASERPLVVTAATELAERALRSTASTPLVRGWIHCLATAIVARTASGGYAKVAACGGGGLPDHLRLAISAELIEANVAPRGELREALQKLLAHADPRVRGAAIAKLPSVWKHGSDSDRELATSTMVAALRSKDTIVSGNAVDAAGKLYAELDAAKTSRDELDAAVVARAREEKDLEVAGALFELIGERKLAAGAEACRKGLVGPPVPARAAAKCLAALGQPVARSDIGPAAVPPVELEPVVGRQVRWRLATTRGEITIRLRPDVAPWAVATIVALTRKGTYNGIELHRVVANFVVQGGDPLESGMGGPGFSIPSEPATSADGAGFVVGGVGIADSGRDSGGSQYFAMHSRAPHLDGRYTWIGAIEGGQKSADALVIGDKVVQATVEIAEQF